MSSMLRIAPVLELSTGPFCSPPWGRDDSLVAFADFLEVEFAYAEKDSGVFVFPASKGVTSFCPVIVREAFYKPFK